MELVVNNSNFVEEITNLTTIDQFVETVFVETNSGIIETQQTVKAGEKLHTISKVINYNLKATRLLIKSCKLIQGKVMISDLCHDKTIMKGDSNCELINKNINNIFALEFSNFEKLEIETFVLNNQGIIKKLFYPNTESDLLKKIKSLSNEKSWILIPEKWIYLFLKDNDFSENQSIVRKLIYCIGFLGKTRIYVNSEETSRFYFGNYDSLTIILNKNLKVEDFKAVQESFQDTKRITIGYEFIQNSPIYCLEVI